MAAKLTSVQNGRIDLSVYILEQALRCLTSLLKGKYGLEEVPQLRCTYWPSI